LAYLCNLSFNILRYLDVLHIFSFRFSTTCAAPLASVFCNPGYVMKSPLTNQLSSVRNLYELDAPQRSLNPFYYERLCINIRL